MCSELSVGVGAVSPLIHGKSKPASRKAYGVVRSFCMLMFSWLRSGKTWGGGGLRAPMECPLPALLLISPSFTMVSGNLPVLSILLIPLICWGPKGSWAATPAASAHESQEAPIQALQTILLRRLGLQKRPEPKTGLVIPRYLLDLYQFCSGKPPPSLQETDLPFLEEQAGKANTVRTFHHVGEISFSYLLKFIPIGWENGLY